MRMNPERFWSLNKAKVKEWFLEFIEQTDIIKFGTIPGTYASGRPTITFDGEATTSTKTYPYLAAYTPTAGHRVALVRAGHTWLILGRVM